jgi:hypothetical protein
MKVGEPRAVHVQQFVQPDDAIALVSLAAILFRLVLLKLMFARRGAVV